MLKKYALEEYADMKAITNLPGIDKYIVSMPDICVPLPDRHFKTAVAECENEDFPTTQDEDFRLLLYEDGGMSLRQFEKQILPSLPKSDVHIFLTKIFDLLEGICFFNKNDIIHHDIKSHNIVYNLKTNVIKFIDFGIIQRRTQLIINSKKNMNPLAVSHEVFPPENKYANEEEYKKSGRTMPYHVFIEKLAYTIDSYGLGRMMKLILALIIKYTKEINMTAMKELFIFFGKMSDIHIETRTYDVCKLADEYKKILVTYNIWNTNKMQIIQSKVSTPIPMDLTIKERSSLSNVLTASKKCKAGYVRNRSGRCRRTRTRTCSSDMKERNPITNRCVVKCKSGYRRNNKFKCRRSRKSIAI
jgi:serine/threonine protein kinase